MNTTPNAEPGEHTRAGDEDACRWDARKQYFTGSCEFLLTDRSLRSARTGKINLDTHLASISVPASCYVNMLQSAYTRRAQHVKIIVRDRRGE